jgi:tetratricopeptide (TPR) repeat protein
MADDDAAQAQVDDWITENKAFAAKGAGASDADLNRRILERFAPIKQGYEDFIKRHPDHANARVAFGSFLNDLHDEEGAEAQWEKGRELDPKNPAAWNNLAGVYGEGGKVKKAFEYYAKAIELNPLEPLYYHNFGTTVYLFRKDAREFYNLTEQQVFDKALELYSKALKLDPDNFPLASDVAQTYYGIKPLRAEEALRAWTNTLAIAHDDIEREGVYLHLARIKLAAGRFDEARQHVNSVTNEAYADLKQRLTHNLNEQEKEAKEGKGANAPGVISVPKAEGAQAPTSKLQAPEKSQAPAAKP